MLAQATGATCPDTEDRQDCATNVCPEVPAAATSPRQTAMPSAAAPSSRAPQANEATVSLGSSPNLLVTNASPLSPPKTNPVGVLYLEIAAPAEALAPSGVVEVRSQLVRHLAQIDASIGEANIALDVLAGSIVIRVTLSGENVDCAKLTKQLETEVSSGRFSKVVIRYVPTVAVLAFFCPNCSERRMMLHAVAEERCMVSH